MIYAIKRSIVWISRFTHSRGFGVQSPTAYRFLRYVINEHYPYYAYYDLGKTIPNLDSRRRKLCKLYFRISNYCQAEKCLIYGADSDAYAEYIKAGCHKSEVIIGGGKYPINTNDRNNPSYIDTSLNLLSTRSDYKAIYEDIANHASEKTILIIQHIKRNPLTRHFWRNVENDTRTGITFDLYYCGIVMFDKKIVKQKYKVNF